MQGQSVRGKLRSNEAAKSPKHHIEHTELHAKTILTRTFLICDGKILQNVAGDVSSRNP